MVPDRWRREFKMYTFEMLVKMLNEEKAEVKEQLKFLYAASHLSSDI
jgi:hypothetical protein